MGYSATKVDGGSILIPRTNTAKFLELIEPKEERIGHISWCDTVAEYRVKLNNNTDDITYTLLEDFGFVMSKDEDFIVLSSWGGDKIGSSWDDVWEVLAQVVYMELDDYQWVMMGEDGQLWGERLYKGKNTKHEVATKLLNKS